MNAFLYYVVFEVAGKENFVEIGDSNGFKFIKGVIYSTDADVDLLQLIMY